ncbi:DUF4012 domain-containing protein [Candidatus Roizmanbacteria bacterium]|nr:DUF4012 domain-containing protein [Candidatus Roizmanbacteria bacterium]
MTQQTETIEESSRVLIVAKKHAQFVTFLKNQLKKYQTEVFFSPTVPKNLNHFSYCLFINDKRLLQDLSALPQKKIAFIFLNTDPFPADYLKKLHDYNATRRIPFRIIHITGDLFNAATFENILWFILSTSKETYLPLVLPMQQKKPNQTPPYSLRLLHFSRQKIFGLVFLLLFLTQFVFIIPLLFSSFFAYRGAIALRDGRLERALSDRDRALPFLLLTRKTYSLSRPTLLFFSAATVVDNVLDTEDKALYLIQLSANLKNNLKLFTATILNKEKTPEEIAATGQELQTIRETLLQLSETMTVLQTKMPTFIPSLVGVKQKLRRNTDLLSQAAKFIEFLPNLLGKEGEQKYLLLFANNMELRPGGGFIGSFGIVTIKDYTLNDLHIYDVYDADGQLIPHVEPPAAIRKYLNQPHFFLRDSAFSPDFPVNFEKAKFFLEKEIKLNGFNGGALITTSAIQNIIAAYGNLYLPDFQETVNERNFYLKAQIHAETNFFPGSTQKKGFLSSLTQQLLVEIDAVNPLFLLKSIRKSLDEKQIVVTADLPSVQKLLDTYYWSGRMIEPKCGDVIPGCISDYIFPVDANLGVNKANFFIARTMKLTTKIDLRGKITHVFSLTIRNGSPAEVFPGGTYRNYFQLFLPPTAAILTVTKNNVLVDGFDQNTGVYRSIGALIEVPPRDERTITVTYELPLEMPRGKNVYQLVFQKQIGSTNTDVSFNYQLAHNLALVNQNFSPLVNGQEINYNTNLTADKLFFLEINKD